MSDIRPLGERILVKSDTRPPSSAVIALTDDHGPEMSGTVVALGDGPLKAAVFKREIVQDVRRLIEDAAEQHGLDASPLMTQLSAALDRYAAVKPTAYEVQVGDHVIFAWNVGTKVEYDGESYILMTEDDPIAILEDEQVA